MMDLIETIRLHPEEIKVKTNAAHIIDLENARAAKAARMQEVISKSIEQDRTTDQTEGEEFDKIDAEVKAIDVDLVRLERLEKMKLK